MKIGDVWAQLENDLSWRQNEIRMLSNTGASLRKEADRDRYRRAQLVMLYAHLEGFTKVAFGTYVNAINSESLMCSQVLDCLAAAAFDDVFHALAFGDEKRRVFTKPLPSDGKLKVYARQRDFFAELDSLLNRRINISDAIVNTEDNLGPSVLRRNLFRLGFPLDLFSRYEISIDELLNRRNSIAHGLDDTIVPQRDYDRLQRSVFEFMDHVALEIVQCLENRCYLKSAALAAVVP